MPSLFYTANSEKEVLNSWFGPNAFGTRSESEVHYTTVQYIKTDYNKNFRKYSRADQERLAKYLSRESRSF